MPEPYEEIITIIKNEFKTKILSICVKYDALTITLDAEYILSILKFLRDHSSCSFTQLIDICAVDYPNRPLRFDVVYHLLSMTQNQRVRVKIQASETTQIPSSTDLFHAANWYEREAFDLYGVLFSAHPDLRRLLTDYGFVGHPLRKDFPLTGELEIRWDEEKRSIIHEAVKLQQEFRDFDFISPWENIHNTHLKDNKD